MSAPPTPGAARAPAAAAAPVAASVARLSRHARLRFDKTRDRWVILAPERVLVPDATAVAVLERLDGRSLGAVAEDLARVYAAPAEAILADCLALVAGLAEQGLVTIEAGGTDA